MMRCFILVTAALLTLSAVAGSSAEPEQTPGAVPSSPLQSDLVRLADGKFRIDHFESCELGGSDTKGSLHARRLQLLIHSEAPQKEISRDRFVAGTVRAVVREIDKLALDKRSGKSEARATSLECREIEAPVGDVDYEIAVSLESGAVKTSVVDVAKRNLTSPTSARHSGDRCIGDSVGKLYCAQAPTGTAVKTHLGQVVCARGECVRAAMGEWRCARAAGGWAELNASGRPECERGCYSPTTTQCERMR